MLQQSIKAYTNWNFGVRIAILTIYIAVLNSYALFVVYPSIKTTDWVMVLLNLVIYVVLAIPLIAYIVNAHKHKPHRLVIILGLLLMLGATVFQCLVGHITIPILIVHILFYLFAGMVEETLWRGKLWQMLSGKIKNQIGVWGIVTAHFTILHIPFALLEKQMPLGFIAQVLGLGILLGGLRIVTKRISIPAFAHAIINMVVYT